MTHLQITLNHEAEQDRHAVYIDRQLSHHVGASELKAALDDAREGFWRNSRESGAGLGKRVYELFNGSGGQLDRPLQECYHNGEALTLVFELPFELDALPVELLWKSTPGSSQEAGGFSGFLLLNSQIHLVRRVNERHQRQESVPENRALNLLFMAASPRNAHVRDLLNFEKEEESIFKAVERFPVDLTVEDSGSVEGLQEAIEFSEGYDVVHLSGHAGSDFQDGPVFYMEDEFGDTESVTPVRLWDALRERPPRVLFLSGCETGKSDKVNALESFGVEMVKHGIPIVLGWGLRVSDAGATLLGTELYHQLGMGKPLSEAVQRARQALQDRYHPWPLLRVFSDAMPDAPLIRPGRKPRRRTHRGTLHKHLQGSQVTVLQEGFVGRRQEIQAGTRVLKGADEQCGLLIHGPAGVGKSCLAGKLLERIPDKDPIVLHGVLKESALRLQLHHLFERKGNDAGLRILNADAEFPEKLKALLREVFPELPVVFLFDDFEQNLIRKGDGHWLRPEALEIVLPLLTALDWAEGQANLILTSRYPFVLEHEGRNLPQEHLCAIPLMSLREADLKKKQAELKHIEKSPHHTLYNEIGGGNPRLLEWLDKIAEREEDHDLESLRRALADKREEFRMTYLADVLAETEGRDFHQFLRRASVFRRPVPAEAFDGIMSRRSRQIPLLGGEFRGGIRAS